MKLFLSQKILEEWALAEKADSKMESWCSRERRRIRWLRRSTRRLRDDTYTAGRVKTTSQLGVLHAEHYVDSCLVGRQPTGSRL